VVDPAEAAVVALIYDLLVNQDLSLRGIAAHLNARNIPSPTALGKGRGAGWSVGSVTDVLTNPAYVGVGYLGAGRTDKRGKFELVDDVRKAGVCPVLIDPALWEAAQAVLARRKRTKRQPVKGSGALSGVVVCGHCGRRMAATLRSGGRVAYVCNSQSLLPGRHPCRQWSVYESDLRPLVVARLIETIDGALLTALQARPRPRWATWTRCGSRWPRWSASWTTRRTAT
jgi:hypothetical protein